MKFAIVLVALSASTQAFAFSSARPRQPVDLSGKSGNYQRIEGSEGCPDAIQVDGSLVGTLSLGSALDPFVSINGDETAVSRYVADGTAADGSGTTGRIVLDGSATVVADEGIITEVFNATRGQDGDAHIERFESTRTLDISFPNALIYRHKVSVLITDTTTSSGYDPLPGMGNTSTWSTNFSTATALEIACRYRKQ